MTDSLSSQPPAAVSTSNPPRALVVIPTYNESASVPRLIERLLDLPENVDVLVVDDNSPDGTGDRVRGEPTFGTRVYLLPRPTKLGLGSAYREAFQWALSRGYNRVVTMDADLSHDPQDVPKLLASLDTPADLAIGSRYVHGVSVLNWPLWRLTLSISAGAFVRAVTGLNLRDPTSGFKAMNRNLLSTLDWRRIRTDGYGFQIATHFQATHAGLKVIEVPIVFTERRDGRSKLSRRIAIEAVGLVLKLGVARLHRRVRRPHSRDS